MHVYYENKNYLVLNFLKCYEFHVIRLTKKSHQTHVKQMAYREAGEEWARERSGPLNITPVIFRNSVKFLSHKLN